MSDTTDFIKSIPDFVNSLQIAMQTPWGWVILLGLVIWIFINKDFSHFFDLLDKKETKKLERLEKFLTTDFPKNNSRNIDESNDETSVAKDIWDAIHFKNATGIYAEAKLRRHLIRLYHATSSKIKWNTIKKALPYIEICRCGDIYIRKMDVAEYLIYLYNGFVGVLFLVSSIGLFLFGLFIHKASTGLFYILGLAIVSLLISMLAFAQNWSNLAAKRIKQELSNDTLPSNESSGP